MFCRASRRCFEEGPRGFRRPGPKRGVGRPRPKGGRHVPDSGGTIGTLIVLVGFGWEAGVGVAPGQVPPQEPTRPEAPQEPTKAPGAAIPKRPGFTFPKRPDFAFPKRPDFAFPKRPATSTRPQLGMQWRRPGMGSDKPPAYRMEVTGSRRVSGVYRSEIFTTRSPVEQWEVFFPAAMELSRQGAVRSSLEPGGEMIK